MSIVSALFDNKIRNFEQAFGVKDITTPAMKTAIQDWYNLYYATNLSKDEDPCQRLPVTIVNKLTKTIFSEYEATTDNEFAKAIMTGLERRRKQAIQHCLIGGECFLKPLLMPDGRIEFSTIQRRNYLVLARNETDAITDIGTQESTEIGGKYYTLLERRTIDARGYLTIQNRLYQSTDKESLGVEVPLSTLEKYKDLERVNRLPQPIWSLGLIHLKNPLENCVDGSEDGVSVYAPAAGLIHLINVNEKQINGEFERGESRIIVSSDLMEKDPRTGARSFKDHVFVGLDEDPDRVGVTIFSPAFREQSFLARKREYLRNIESLIGLKRGILSEVEEVEKTATEITSSSGEYNITITDFQEVWTNAVKEALRVCSILGEMYRIHGATQLDPEKDVTIDWGDGVLFDRARTWKEYQEMVAAGLLKPEIAIAWYFGLPFPETPEAINDIRAKYMPQLEELTRGSGGEDDE